MTEPTQPPDDSPPETAPPPGYPPLPPGYPPCAIYRPFNTYAILSIIFAVAILPPLGIYFGNKAKREIQRTGERGIELATAGIVTGWVLSALMGLFLIILCGFFVTFLTGFFGMLSAATTFHP